MKRQVQTISTYEKDNELYIGDYSFKSLADTYKTPLYVFDEAHLRYKLDKEEL